MLKRILLYLLLITFQLGWSQGDSVPDSIPTVEKKDSTTSQSLVVKKQEPKKAKSAIRASLYSAILPGAGQIYNRKWWKAPIVWGGFATAIVMHDFYYNKYQFYHKILIYKDQGVADATVAAYSDANGSRFTNISGVDIAADSQSDIQVINDQALKRTQQIYLASAVFYLVQIVDASVDAHFSTFDVSDDLSVKVQPGLLPSNNLLTPSLGLKFSF